MSFHLRRVRSHGYRSKRNFPVCWCSGGSIRGRDSHTHCHLGTWTHPLSVTAAIIENHSTCTTVTRKLHTTNIQWCSQYTYCIQWFAWAMYVCIYVGILPHTTLRYTFTVLPIFSQQITTETRALVTGTKVVTPSIVHNTLICNDTILRVNLHMGVGMFIHSIHMWTASVTLQYVRYRVHAYSTYSPCETNTSSTIQHGDELDSPLRIHVLPSSSREYP